MTHPLSTPHAIATFNGYVEMCDTERVRDLLAEGADPNAFDKKGRAALAYLPVTAEIGALMAMLTVLLGAGADVHRCDKRGNSALFYALDHGQRQEQVELLAVSEALVRAGASLNQVSVDHHLPAEHPHREATPLHQALIKQCFRIADRFLELGADPLLATPTFRWTALHFAVVESRFAERFVRMGANPFTPDSSGDTPLDLAGDHAQARMRAAWVEREQSILRGTLDGLAQEVMPTDAPSVRPGRVRL